MIERKDRNGGGAGIMLNKRRKIVETKDLFSSSVKAVRFNGYTNELRFRIGSEYNPPDNEKTMKDFLSCLERILRTEAVPKNITVGMT